MCEWGAMRDERPADAVGGGGTALWATGADDDAPAVEGFITLDIVCGGVEEVEREGKGWGRRWRDSRRAG